MKSKTTRAANDSKKIAAIVVLAIIFIAVVVSTDWSTLSEPRDAGLANEGTTTSASTSRSGKEIDSPRPASPAVNSAEKTPRTRATAGRGGKSQSNKLADWSKAAAKSEEVDLMPLTLEEIIRNDPFHGGPSLGLAGVVKKTSEPEGGDVNTLVKNEEAKIDLRRLNAVYIEKGKAFAMINGKVVPIDEHGALLERLNGISPP